VIDLAGRFFDAKGLEGGAAVVDYYRKHLGRFLHAFGGLFAQQLA
jgi:hypothetical protein